MSLVHILNTSMLNIIARSKEGSFWNVVPFLVNMQFLSLSFRIRLNTRDSTIGVPKNQLLDQFCKQTDQQTKEIPTK